MDFLNAEFSKLRSGDTLSLNDENVRKDISSKLNPGLIFSLLQKKLDKETDKIQHCSLPTDTKKKNEKKSDKLGKTAAIMTL